jgi:molybdopterin/thiamine biosynthesis adenylyltransferase
MTTQKLKYEDIVKFIYECEDPGTLLDIPDHAINRNANKANKTITEIVEEATAVDTIRWGLIN